MNEYIAKISNFIFFDALTGRSWLDIVSILAPSVILITILFCMSFFIKNRKWKFSAYAGCLVLALVYLPYELLRQSTAIARADANINEVHNSLQGLLNSANLAHLKAAANKEVSADILDELMHGLNQEKKKDLILVSWLIAENEKSSLNQINDKQKSLADEIKSSLNDTKTEIIASRPPIEKISDTIVKRLDSDINQLVETKMQAFKQEIDHSLDTFKDNINAFVQGELNNYQEKLAVITQQNVDELKNYSNKANQAFSSQANKISQQSLKKIDAARDSIDEAGTTIAQTVTQQIKQLSASVELSQKKSDILFEYNECMRTAGLLDIHGKEQQCKAKLNQDMSNLKSQ
ncbi:hypothetical protein [Nitrosomonas sp. Nm166]|uniref:hypothetical protein n=1 Tax=Nitrosomonas sp. Nm166 TaxID=1881054 RepID=UPI0008F0F7CD|nr:hypothetical protein [Nitrosomonas sp. Nm166]SFE90667.1 hypothetical protein SAMN05428977_103534 [Nitrosomonas sp. Nm166]